MLVGNIPVENQVRPWRVLAQRDFGLFWVSLLVSAVGDQISNVTIAWQVYQIDRIIPRPAGDCVFLDRRVAG